MKEKPTSSIYRRNVSQLCRKLYDGGLPGINEFAGEVIVTHFSEEELNTPRMAHYGKAKRKLDFIEPFFLAATTGAIINSCVNPTHGEETMQKMRDIYRTSLNNFIQVKASKT